MQGKTIKELQSIAATNGISTHIEMDNVQEGWVGRPKGMQQILWERGLLDPTVMYIAKIKADDDAETENKIQYSDVLADCPDFANELTSLQHLANELGSSIDRSMKSHPELASKGIEYSWGRAKCFYRSAKLKDKTGKANFLKLVQTSLSMTTHEGGGLDIHLIRKFSRCARQYILAYYYMTVVRKKWMN